MRRLSGKEFARLLKRRGWTVVRSKGSHFMFEKKGYPLIILPVHGHRTLDLGVQRGLMKAAGLNEEDLIDA